MIRTSSPGRRGDHGMVTAELALGSLIVAFLAIACAWLIGIVGTYLACVDVAAQVARQRARGDAPAAAAVTARAPFGAQVAVVAGAGVVTVTVSVEARPWLAALPTVPLHASAVARLEPGVVA